MELAYKKMYRRRNWIAYADHPTGQGPRAGEPNPFELYRHYERNEINPLPGDSKKPNPGGTDGEKHWVLDRVQILLFQARQAWKDGNLDKYRLAVAELDNIIENSSIKKQLILKAAKKKLTGRF